jgi:hypothetical protein
MKSTISLGIFLTVFSVTACQIDGSALADALKAKIIPAVEQWHAYVKEHHLDTALAQVRLATQTVYVNAAKTKANRNLQKSLSNVTSHLHKVETKQEQQALFHELYKQLTFDTATWLYFSDLWNGVEKSLGEDVYAPTAQLIILSSTLRLNEINEFLATTGLHTTALRSLNDTINVMAQNLSLIHNRIEELLAQPDKAKEVFSGVEEVAEYPELIQLQLFDNAQLSAKDIIAYLYEGTTTAIATLEAVYTLSLLIDMIFYTELYTLLANEYEDAERFNFIAPSEAFAEELAQKLPNPADFNIFA